MGIAQAAMTPTATPKSTPNHILTGPAPKAATAPLSFLADADEEALELECVALPLPVLFGAEEVGEADVAPAEVAPAVDGPDEVAAKGAVDWPSISDWTAAVKLPVIPAIVNLAEKARAGNWGFVASFNEIDWNRTKYSLLSGPMVGSGVKVSED